MCNLGCSSFNSTSIKCTVYVRFTVRENAVENSVFCLTAKGREEKRRVTQTRHFSSDKARSKTKKNHEIKPKQNQPCRCGSSFPKPANTPQINNSK